jgi:cob(I)alamin adenosyltransferase
VIVRRAERCLVAVDGLNPLLQRYLNRLSDHLFVMSRVLNDNGAADVLWQPGANE